MAQQGYEKASIDRRMLKGAEGINGKAGFFGVDRKATNGAEGPGIYLENSFSSPPAKSKGSAVILGSTGGRGGDGDSVAFTDVDGAPGGKGGEIFVTQTGALSGVGDQKGPPLPATINDPWFHRDPRWADAKGTGLLLLYSHGGDGGFGNAGMGPGGAGGTVRLDLHSTVETQGANYAGVWGRSLGGRAGGGGTSKDRVVELAGGYGGRVSIDAGPASTIITSGKGATGIVAESLGGAGSLRGNAFYSKAYTSNGGAGGKVEVINSGSITIGGANAAGILAQSIGGRGGDQDHSGGQPGGMGGKGGAVSVAQWNSILTKGEYSFGIIAQSLGGTGGKGGGGVFGGGDGGAAGAGGTVILTNYGKVTTQGLGATAIVAQSIGGGNATSAFQMGQIKPGASGSAGGGAGGSTFFGSGGAGGTGGDADKVMASNLGTVKTSGAEAYGMLLQSIGGGGGAGASSQSLGFGISIAVGGHGGGGGNGKDVVVSREAAVQTGGYFGPSVSPSITTTGAGSTGLIAMSVGGGGGVGGAASAASAGVIGSVSIAVGGAGGDGGNGGRVTVENESIISTDGRAALGIQAKSIGGGGGNAGNASAYALAVAPPGEPALAVSFAAGGKGGKGGNGDTVTVHNKASITTHGNDATGIEAMSVGGGGGSAGTATSAADMLSADLNLGLAVSLGGSGGGGGSGKAVKVVNYSSIHTFGDFAAGIVAQSVGGGGGNGGTGSAKAAPGLSFNDIVKEVASEALPLADSFTAKIAVGGSGGGGGAGGTVTIDNTRFITTEGKNSFGIFAQSVGGGGGNGAGYLASGKGTLSGSLSLGGSGGAGGKGDTVWVTNNSYAHIEVEGPGSIGIFAQSVGGGGGNGGSFTGTTKKAPEFDSKPAEFVVQVLDELLKVDGLIVSAIGDPKEKKAIEDYKFFDKKSPAQKKIGHAKNALKIIKILVDSDKSLGERLVKAGGFTVAGLALQKLKSSLKDAIKDVSKPANLPNVELTLAFGGSGGTAGAGGAVTVNNYGTIATTSDNSWGIFAQSIGGGGGRGGSGVATGNNSINANLSFGADGGRGGKGGDVSVTNSWDISTRGAGSIGVFGQSVGGGGGAGALAASGNSISVSGNVRMGGDAGESSPGGTVNITNKGTIATRGREAHAIVAQSVGGGGGAFVFSRPDPTSSTVLAADPDEKEALDLTYQLLKQVGVIKGDGTFAGGGEEDISSTILPMPAMTFAMGGKGGRGGDGGAVELTHSGTIRTEGMGAFGIFGQSVGGGGGFSVDASKSGLLEQTTKLGGDGGVGGAGGKITLTFGDKASIGTEGKGAHAVFLQSIGGGGGYTGVGYAPSTVAQAEIVRDSAASGNGGDIALRMADARSSFSLATQGKAAHAIFAQSLGGGGGWTFDVNGKASEVKDSGKSRSRAVGQGGVITLETRGEITASGEDAYGIYLQSGVQKTDGTLDGLRRGGRIMITHEGTIFGGSGRGAGIRIDGGNDDNKIVLKSSSRVDAKSGTAILGSVRKDTLENHGEIVGTVDLAPAGGSTGDIFTNMSGGRYAFNSSGFVNVGAGGTFRNDGVLDLDRLARVTGRFEQSYGGRMIVHFMPSPQNGWLNNGDLQVQGQAFIEGSIEPKVSWLLPGTYQVASATGGINGAPRVGGPQGDGIPLSWAIGRDWGSITLTPKARFDDPQGVTLTRDQGEAARYLQAAWNAGSTAQGGVFPRFLGIQTPGQYGAALDEITLESTQYVTNTKIKDARMAMRAAMSCPAFENATTLMREGECVWGRVAGGYSRMGASADEGGYRQRQTSYRMGAQKEFARDWFVGATASFTRGELEDADGLTGSKTDSYDASIAVKRQLGNWLFAASATLGRTEQKNVRAMTIGSTTAVAMSRSHVEGLGARFRAAYELPFANWYVRPYVDLDAIHLRTPAFSEYGASGLDLDVREQRKTLFAINPNIEIGSRLALANGYWARPYASVGFTMLSSDHFTTRASLVGAPAALGTFESRSRIPDKLVDLGLGLQVGSGSGLEFTGEYQAQTGRDFLSHTGSARLAWRF